MEEDTFGLDSEGSTGVPQIIPDGRKRLRYENTQVTLVVKNPPANAGDLRDTGSIPGSGRSWRRAWQPTAVFLPGESPQTEEFGKLQFMGLQKVRHD